MSLLWSLRSAQRPSRVLVLLMNLLYCVRFLEHSPADTPSWLPPLPWASLCSFSLPSCLQAGISSPLPPALGPMVAPALWSSGLASHRAPRAAGAGSGCPKLISSSQTIILWTPSAPYVKRIYLFLQQTLPRTSYVPGTAGGTEGVAMDMAALGSWGRCSAGETDKQQVTPVISDVGRAMKNPHSPGRWSRAGGRVTFNEVAWERISEKVTFVSRPESQKGADGRSSGGS